MFGDYRWLDGDAIAISPWHSVFVLLPTILQHSATISTFQGIFCIHHSSIMLCKVWFLDLDISSIFSNYQTWNTINCHTTSNHIYIIHISCSNITYWLYIIYPFHWWLGIWISPASHSVQKRHGRWFDLGIPPQNIPEFHRGKPRAGWISSGRSGLCGSMNKMSHGPWHLIASVSYWHQETALLKINKNAKQEYGHIFFSFRFVSVLRFGPSHSISHIDLYLFLSAQEMRGLP